MKIRAVFPGLILGLLLAAAVTTRIRADDGSDHFNAAAWFQRIADRLDLTADQKQQIKGIFLTEKDTLLPLVENLRSSRKELRTAIRADNTTEAAVRTASAKVASVEADLAVERMKLYLKIAPILTDVQKQQLAHFD
jgi:Spy/CpxP family protein refolding chaperone